MCVSSDLKNLEKAFLALPNEGSLPKESVFISTLKGMLRPECNCTLIGNVVSSNFEESLNTLNYVERCKAEMAGGEKTTMDAAGINSANHMLKNLRQLNEEYKREIEQTEQKHYSQFETIKTLFSLDMSLSTMLQNGPTLQDKAILENHRQAAERVKNYTERNNDLDAKIEKVYASIRRVKEKIDDKSSYFGKLLITLRQDLDGQAAECARLKERYNTLPAERTLKLEEERKKLTEEKHNDLEKTLGVLFSSQREIDQLSQTMLRATTAFEDTKRSIESQYKKKMKDYNMTQTYSMISLEDQFKTHWEEETAKLKEFMEEAEEYCRRKRQHKRSLNSEVQKMRALVQTQAEVIRRAEDGSYTDGIKSVSVKPFDKPCNYSHTMSMDMFKKNTSTLSSGRPVTSQTIKLKPINSARGHLTARKF